MPSGQINRAYARYYHESHITYVNMESGNHHYAKMTNNSVDGMSFSSDTELVPGSDISIKMKYFSPNIYSRNTENGCQAKVVWCTKNSNNNNSHYSKYDIGVKYTELMI